MLLPLSQRRGKLTGGFLSLILEEEADNYNPESDRFNAGGTFFGNFYYVVFSSFQKS